MTPSGITVGSPTLGTPSLISMRKGNMHKAFIRWREQLYNSAHRGSAFAIVPCSANTVEAQSHRTWTAETRAKIARRLKGNKNGLGHVASAAARKRMRKGCAERSKTDWLAHTTAANQSLAKRRKDSRGVKAAWARRRAEVSR
jgi:hypothetical protein